MRQSHTVTLPGITSRPPGPGHVFGHKVIETRTPMPRKWVGQPLAIIETPGKARHFQRRIAGLVIFAPSWCYADKPPSPATVPGTSLIQTTGCSDGGRMASLSGRGLSHGSKSTSSLCLSFRAGIRYARAVEILRPSATLLDMLAR